MGTGIIILAAGSSSRLGRPKQLLIYEGKTLLERATEAALNSSCKPVLVVLGDKADLMPRMSPRPDLNYLVNERWQEGMSTSISRGLTALLEAEPNLDGVVIAATDQVFLSPGVINALVSAKAAGTKNIIASGYAQTQGSPVLFSNAYFDHLLAINGEPGAKNLLKLHPNDTQIVTFELGHIDIDTEADYTKLIHRK